MVTLRPIRWRTTASIVMGATLNASTKAEAHVHSLVIWRSVGDRPGTRYSPLPSGMRSLPEFVQVLQSRAICASRRVSCGQCHGQYVRNVIKNIMAHDALVPEAGMYANGVSNLKIARIGEAFAPYTDKTGRTYFVPAKIVSNPAPTKEEQERTGELPQLVPWPRFDITFAQQTRSGSLKKAMMPLPTAVWGPTGPCRASSTSLSRPGSTILRCGSLAPTTSAATTDPSGVRRLPRRVRQLPGSGRRGSIRPVRQPGLQLLG